MRVSVPACVVRWIFGRISRSGESVSCPSRVPATVEDRINVCSVILNSVIDGKREPFREQPMIMAEVCGMNAGRHDQRIDIRIQRIQEVTADALRLSLVKFVAVDEVATRGRENSDFHEILFLMFFLAVSQSSNCSSPRAMAACRPVRISPCQSGEVMSGA